MSKYCPEWIFSILAAQTSKEFLSSNNSIAAISRKYSKAINEKYNEVKFEELMDLAENILQFLSEIEAGEEAVTTLMTIYIIELCLKVMVAKENYQVCSHLLLTD